MAEAADIEALIPQLNLSLSEEVTDPVPGMEVTVDLFVHEGSFTTGDGVNAIQMTIEYDSSVAKVEEPVRDNIEIHADEFGIEIGPDKWLFDADTNPITGNLIITMNNQEIDTGTLQEPENGWPGNLLTITFTVQNFQQGAFTNVVFLEGDTETFFLTILDKFTIALADSGKISLRESSSKAVELSLLSTKAPPVPGSEVPINLSVHGGYEDIDLIDGVLLTIAYDSTVVDLANDPPVHGTDIITHLDRFGVTDGWEIVLPPIRDDLVPPDQPELDKQLVVQILNTNPDQFLPLGTVFPEDLLTIKFIVQSDNSELSTRLLFIDELHSYFQKRDKIVNLGKLPVDLDYDPPGPDEDPHGDIALSLGLLAATINIDPNTLNLKNKGQWITCYIELPEGYDVADIDVDTVLLESLFEVQQSNRQNDVLIVKFDRQDVIAYLEFVLQLIPPDEVTLTVTGELADEIPLEGSDTIRVIEEGKK